ncbi:hypothetical protein [Secundilactobacillus silagei]|uniref:hypothetical protein n=1 Tax=Secundilactobacillus silagei TaxID=1293415 RepID=UPI000AF66D76|nr:hypothetical protein [Secundilactobacillus silagei]
MQLSKQLLTTLAVAGSVLLVGGHSAHALSPNSSQPRTDMVDLSSWQSNLGASDYQKLHDAGVKAVAIKLLKELLIPAPSCSSSHQLLKMLD